MSDKYLFIDIIKVIERYLENTWMEEKIGNKMKHKNLYRENVLLYNENFKMLPVLDYCLLDGVFYEVT